jgi:hypothetical protein
MSTTTAVDQSSSLKRASDRLHGLAGTAEACYDDLAAPSWESYRRSRERFLDRRAARESARAMIGLPNEGRHAR